MGKIIITENEKNRIINLYKKDFLILENIDPISKINELKTDIEYLLGFYEKQEDGKIIDIKSKSKINPETIKKLGPYYKTKIESVLVGTKEDKKDLSSIEKIKNEIVTGKWKDLIGDYDKISTSKGQIDDFYTNIRCEYFRKNEVSGRTIDHRPWCKIS